ncbi:MAG: hypothetical protein ACLRUW_17190 [Bacteroides faecis]
MQFQRWVLENSFIKARQAPVFIVYLFCLVCFQQERFKDAAMLAVSETIRTIRPIATNNYSSVQVDIPQKKQPP